MGRFIYKSRSAFLTERTIRGQVRKALVLVVNGVWENDHAIKRNMVKWYFPPKGERLERSTVSNKTDAMCA